MKTYEIVLKLLNLQLFADGGGEGGGTDGAGADGQGAEGAQAVGAAEGKDAGKATKAKAGREDLSKVRYGIQDDAQEEPEPEEAKPEPEPEKPRKISFEQALRENPEYQAELQRRIDQAINRRFAKSKAAEEQNGKLQPALNLLAAKYGVKAGDTDALIDAINGDSELIEQQAMDAGMEPDAYREYQRIKAENEAYRKAEEERERQGKLDSAYQEWQRQAAEARKVFPGLDLRTEVKNEQFASLLGAGIDVLTAYKVVHTDEISRGLVQRAANDARKQTVASIQQRQSRPRESASGANNAASVRNDISKFTQRDFDEIMRRAQRGERIRF